MIQTHLQKSAGLRRIKAHLLDLDRVSVHYRVDASTVRLFNQHGSQRSDSVTVTFKGRAAHLRTLIFLN